MSSDRGTIPRGTGAGADAGAWPEPTSPAGRRLPSAPRERKPALAALAVVLVVGGALAAALLVLKAGHKTGAIEISQPVGQGQKIPLSSMQEVQVTSGTGINYVPWNEASQVAQTYAATMLPPGTLLTPQMTTAVNTATRGMTVVGLALKDGQLPDGLQVGDHVGIFETSDNDGAVPQAPDERAGPERGGAQHRPPGQHGQRRRGRRAGRAAPGVRRGRELQCGEQQRRRRGPPGQRAGGHRDDPLVGRDEPSPGGTARSHGSASPSGGPTSPSSGGTTPPSSGGTG